MSKKSNTRTTEGLRDILFEEIEELRTENKDPQKSMVVANIAKQIINTAKIELAYTRTIMKANEEGHTIELGGLKLGSQ